MATECDIAFDNNPQGVFYGGQILSGTVQLITKKEKTIRAIHITIEGYASVHWTESRSRRENNRTVTRTEHFRAHDQYLRSRTYVMGREGGDSFDLEPGKYCYTFQVALPNQLPSSLEGIHGHIRYQVVVTLDRPWRFDNVFKQPFTVLYSLDLNRDPGYKVPLNPEEHKTLGCCCCDSGAIKAKLLIPFCGYAPGQKIPFVFYVDNESTVDCTDVRVKMEQEIAFTSDTPYHKTRRNTKKITQTLLADVLRLTKKELKGFIEIPSIAPSSLNSCRIINVSYTLTAEVSPNGCHTDLEIIVPITIGSVPLYESATNPANVITQQPTAPELSNTDGDSPPGYNTLVPPSYEQATEGGDMFVPEDEEGHTKVEPYVPKYPVYYNFATAPPTEGNHHGEGNSQGTTYGWQS